jgi:hypothetical protein
MYQDSRPGFAKPAGDEAADAIGRSGDECRLPGQLLQRITSFGSSRHRNP